MHILYLLVIIISVNSREIFKTLLLALIQLSEGLLRACVQFFCRKPLRLDAIHRLSCYIKAISLHYVTNYL